MTLLLILSIVEFVGVDQYINHSNRTEIQFCR